MLYEKHADVEGHLYFSLYDSAKIAERNFAPIPHFHNSIEIWIVKSGCVHTVINGERYKLCAGDVAFVDKLIPHTCGFGEVGDEVPSYYVIVASAAYLINLAWLEREALPTVTRKKDGFEELLRIVEWNYAQKDDMNSEMRTGFVTMILGYMQKYCGVVPRKSDVYNRLIINVLMYLNEHYKEDVSLKVLSRKFGYELTYLSRTFNKYVGMNIREYVNRLRISEINRLRRTDSSTPLYKIAEECGYENMPTYFRANKKYGESEN